MKKRKIEVINQDEIVKKAKGLNGITILKIHEQKTHIELDSLDKTLPRNTEKIVLKRNERFHCYGCGESYRKTHPHYIFSCVNCGQLFEKYRNLSRDLSGLVAFVTGARAKLGHQIALKLLRANASVICSSRQWESIGTMFSGYSDYEDWKENLFVYPYCLDFDIPNIQESLSYLRTWIDEKFKRLDILINSAAQTIRCREKEAHITEEKNRYDDPKYVTSDKTNSWLMRMGQFEQKEMEELFRVNSIAPCLLVQELIPLLMESKDVPYIINVHAREGLFQVRKDDKHLHTNVAKAALAMMTKCLVKSKLYTKEGKKFSIHGCDPGWFSIDEYYRNSAPFPCPPLDEVDGAARILYPLWRRMDSCSLTRRHFRNFSF